MARGIGEFWVRRVWYGRSRWYWPMLPLSWLYAAVTGIRRSLYRRGILRSQHPGVPVIIVGNVTAGGTGKTPVTIWLVRQLIERGLHPAVVSRGYRGMVGPKPVLATPESNPAQVGDEAVLLAAHSHCPVVVHPDRVAAARLAIEEGADVIVSDDGLQHYRLARDFEIAVIDGERTFGNGRLLPAGPLREPVSRFGEVDHVLVQRTRFGTGERVFRRKGDRESSEFRLVPSAICSLGDEEIRSADEFAGREVHAIAAIGHPERFFGMLESLRIYVIEHPMPDHAEISEGDIDFGDDLDVMMTEKDAVKCRAFAHRRCWYVPVEVEFDPGSGTQWLDALQRKLQMLEARK